MQHLDLTDEEAAALVALLTRTIDGDRYPLSPCIRTLKDILAKLRPEPPKVYATGLIQGKLPAVRKSGEAKSWPKRRGFS
jgi:hypothetical protein